MNDGWAGAVLTGGASTRMGRDKASLLVGGTPMAVRVAAALRAGGAEQVVCIGPSAGGLSAVPDDHPGAGPLGGVLTALRWSPSETVVIAPCDLLSPDPSAFAALAVAADPVASAGADRPLPLGATRAALAPLERVFATGERSLHRALASAGVHLVEVTLTAAALADADTADELPDSAG